MSGIGSEPAPRHTGIDQAERDLAHLAPLLAGRHVLVLGDVMLDRYVHGAVSRISPEAPIPVLRRERHRAVLGGAGNVALNIAALGAHAVLVGIVGQDAAGAEIARLAGCRDGARLSGTVEARLVVELERPTTVKTRFVAGSHQLLRVDEETSATPSDDGVAALLQHVTQALPGVAAMILSDYAKGVLCDAVLGRAIALATAAGIPVIADPKRNSFADYRGVTILTPNAAEAARATGIEALEEGGAERAGTAILAAADCAAVMVTRSERGLTLVRRDDPALHVRAHAQEVSDVSGAGDTLVAVLAVGLAAGLTLDAAARLANVSAGLSVRKPGTAVVPLDELVQALHRHELLEIDGKIMSRAAAVSRVEGWRALGLRVGFTNGCFDLIHPGHVRLLAKARAACDRLVVGLNDDASVRRLKGAERPVQGEAARATVMASMGSVDLVTLFEEDTPLSLIAALRPDLLVKGADYRPDQVVGADLVQHYGGDLLLVDLAEGHSTTRTLARLKGGEPPPPSS